MQPPSESLWAGVRWGGGINRLTLDGQVFALYGSSIFGSLARSGIADIQIDRSGPTRRVLVGFRANGSTPGAIGIYTGE